MYNPKLIRAALNAVLVLFVCLGVLQVINWLTPGPDYKKLYQASLAESESYRNKAGQLETKVEAIEASAREFSRLQVAKTDSLTLQLQQVVKEAKGRVRFAAVVSSTTTERLQGKTLVRPDTIAALPTYVSRLQNEFTDLDIVSGPDSTTAILKYRKRLEVWNTYENPVFKRGKVYTYVRDTNPYAADLSVKSYSEPLPKARRGIWFAAGFAAAVATAVAIF